MGKKKCTPFKDDLRGEPLIDQAIWQPPSSVGREGGQRFALFLTPSRLFILRQSCRGKEVGALVYELFLKDIDSLDVKRKFPMRLFFLPVLVIMIVTTLRNPDEDGTSLLFIFLSGLTPNVTDGPSDVCARLSKGCKTTGPREAGTLTPLSAFTTTKRDLGSPAPLW